MYRTLTFPSLALGALALAAAAHAAGNLDKSDTKFLTKAAGGGMFEVQVGQLAADKATDPDIKAFGTMLVKDHSAANDQLKQLAAAKSVSLPTELPKDMQKTLDTLQGESGAKFDKDFIKLVGIDDHKDDIKLFEKNGQKAKDADVQAFATKTLPTLREHLQHAEKIKGDKKL
ncbi:MAG: DUF4142 domain-containing protein [Pseudomonadota bacterium]